MPDALARVAVVAVGGCAKRLVGVLISTDDT